jgi:exonuclease VII small subunit
MNPATEIEELVERLEVAAERLRSNELSAEEAAHLVEECAELAGQASAELERRARGVQEAPAEDQEPLTGPRQDSLL